MPSAGLMSDLGWGSLMMMISRNGRGGLGLSWRWRMTCLCIILVAGRLWGTESMPSECSMRTRSDSRRSGAIPCRRGGGWRCGRFRVMDGGGVRSGFTNGFRNGGEKGDGARGGGSGGLAGVGDESLAGIVRLKPDLLQRARVSLTMIVRDEEKNLPHCLESVRGVFDEIVVLDTGSRDRTVEIARSFGARVFDFVWVDDFAAARNARWRVPPAIMRFGSMPTI